MSDYLEVVGGTYSHQVTQTDSQADQQRRHHSWQGDVGCHQDNQNQLEGNQRFNGDRLVELDTRRDLNRKITGSIPQKILLYDWLSGLAVMASPVRHVLY